MFKIPPSCQIGAITYRIVASDQVLDALDVRGQITSDDETIRLAFGKRSAPQIFATLVHEFVHSAAHETGHELEEGAVAGIASGVAQALLSMGLAPDFGDIPAE